MPRIVVPILQQVQLSVETSFAIIGGVLDVLIRLLGGDFRGAWEAAQGIVDTVLDPAEEGVQRLAARTGKATDVGVHA